MRATKISETSKMKQISWDALSRARGQKQEHRIGQKMTNYEIYGVWHTR